MPSKSIGKRISAVKIGQKKVLIKFDNGDELEILPNTFIEFNLFKGKILSSNNIKEIKDRNNIEKYYQSALTLLSRKSYSERKIKEKLEKLGAKEVEIEKVVKELHKYSLLNDDEVLDEYLEYAEIHCYGYNRIKEELYKRGISKAKIDKLPYDETKEISKAKKLLPKLQKRYQKENNFMKKKKINDSLVRNGFGFEIAREVASLAKENPRELELDLLRADFGTQFMRYNYKYLGEEVYNKVLASLLRKGYLYSDIELIKGEYFK